MIKNENELVVDPFRVYVRVRPFLEREILNEGENKYINKPAVLVEGNFVYVVDPESQELYGKKEKCFSFDQVFKEKDNNEMIFNKIIKNLVNNILMGYNSTGLAYGVTGTGKTHTMFGDIYLNLNFEKGICMYAVDYLFDKINKDTDKSYKITINYLEIYNEQVIDLLVEKPLNTTEGNLMIVEDPQKGTTVPDLTEYTVSSSDQVINLIILGNSRRTMAPTGANQFSSRSHAILQINVKMKTKSKEKEEYISSKFQLVDLAGSERGSLEKGIRREEGSNINKSLLALGNCINILSDKSKKGSFVPYRDSKLTRLLKDSLGGNIATIMIACVSPSSVSYDETINTLNYASRARKIEKKVTRNIKEFDPYSIQYKEIIDNLKNEITQLKDTIKNQNILIRNKPIESFRDDRDLINLNLNLNLNINNVNHQNKLNNYYNTAFNHMINNLDGDEENENYLQNEQFNLRNNYQFFEKNPQKYSNNISGEILQTKQYCNFETYEELLNKNLNNFTDEDFQDFEKKLEGLYFDKLNLEDQIQKGSRDTTITDKYTIIKGFYEKYVELINEKMIENIEQNMMLKFNLREILKLNLTNTNNLNCLKEQLNDENLEEDDISKLNEEKILLEKTIEQNEIEKDNIGTSLEKNLKINKILKKLMIKFFSNTQMKEIKDLQEAFTGVTNDKRELEIKNKKYQEFLNSVLKEKEDRDLRIHELTRELEKTRKNLIEKEKLFNEAKERIRELESSMKIGHRKTQNYKTGHKKHLRTTSVRRRLVNEDFNRITPKKRYLNDKFNNIIDQGKKKIPDLNVHTGISNNYININLNSKIPRVTAFLHGNQEQSNNTQEISNSIAVLKNNLIKKKSRSKSPKNKKAAEMDKIIESHLSSKYNNVLSKHSSYKSTKMRKISEVIKKDLHMKDFEINKELEKGTVDKGNYKIPQKDMENHCNTQTIKRNYQTNFRLSSHKHNIPELNNHSISISAVTFNNEVNLNSSQLEIMENVLNLDGINNRGTMTPIIKSAEAKRSLTHKENNPKYAEQFLNKKKIVSELKPRQGTPIILVNEENKVLENSQENKPSGHTRTLSLGDQKKDIFKTALLEMREMTDNK